MYTEENIIKAIEKLLRKKMTFKEASDVYRVPMRILLDRFHNYKDMIHQATQHKKNFEDNTNLTGNLLIKFSGVKNLDTPSFCFKNVVFNNELDHKLISFALKSMPLSKNQFCTLIYDLTKHLPYEFDDKIKNASIQLYHELLKKYSESIRKNPELPVYTKYSKPSREVLKKHALEYILKNDDPLRKKVSPKMEDKKLKENEIFMEVDQYLSNECSIKSEDLSELEEFEEKNVVENVMMKNQIFMETDQYVINHNDIKKENSPKVLELLEKNVIKTGSSIETGILSNSSKQEKNTTDKLNSIIEPTEKQETSNIAETKQILFEEKSKLDNDLEDSELSAYDEGYILLLESENVFGDKKYKQFYEETKTKVLKDLKSGKSKSDIIKEYKIGYSTLKLWINNEKMNLSPLKENSKICEINKIKEDDNNIKKCEVKKSTPLLNQALLAWIDRCKQHKIEITADMIREKASCFNKLLNENENFIASFTWLKNWRKRYNINLSSNEEKIHVEHMTSAPATGNNDLLDISLTKMIGKYGLLQWQIFKCDISELYYKSLPEKNMMGDRVIVMACSNADGSFKLPIVIFGKSHKPETFKILERNLPVHYIQRKNTWLDSKILTEWIKNEFTPRVTEFLKTKSHPLHSCLIIDNVPTYGFKYQSKNTLQIHLIPPNITLFDETQDKCILNNIKLMYKYKLLNSILNAQDDGEVVNNYLKKITLYDMFHWISKAWDEVKPEIIVKSWKKLMNGIEDNSDVFIESEKIYFNMIFKKLKQVNDYNKTDEKILKDWILQNNFSIPTDEQLIQIIKKDSYKVSINYSQNIPKSIEILSPSQVLHNLNEVITYFEHEEGADASNLMMLIQLKEKIMEVKINLKNNI